MRNALQLLKGPVGALCGIVLALVGLTSGLDALVDRAQRSISQAAIAKAEGGIALTGQYLIGYPYVYAGLSALIVALIAIGAAFWMAYLAARNTRSLGSIEVEYARFSEAAQRIVYQIYNPTDPRKEPPPRIVFSEIECVFRISAGGDTEVEQTYTVVADVNPAHFWNVRIMADEFARPAATLADLNFTAQSLTAQCAIEILPLSTQAQERRIALFFLPEILPAEERRFKVGYKWRGWFGELFTPKAGTHWMWSYFSAKSDDLAEVTFRFEFEKACGRILCEDQKPAIPGNTLILSSGANEETVWTFHNPSYPIGRLQWDLKFLKV